MEYVTELSEAVNEQDRRKPNPKLCLACPRDAHDRAPFTETDEFGRTKDTVWPNESSTGKDTIIPRKWPTDSAMPDNGRPPVWKYIR